MLYFSFALSYISIFLSLWLPYVCKVAFALVCYLILSFAGVFDFVPAWLQMFMAVMSVIFAAWVVVRKPSPQHKINPYQVLRAIERRNNLPLASLSFKRAKPAMGLDEQQQKLWLRKNAALKQNALLVPEPLKLNSALPFGWGYAFLSAFVLALFLGNGQANPLPRMFSVEDIYQVQVRVTPPEYTDQASQFLKSEKSIALPEKTIVEVLVRAEETLPIRPYVVHEGDRKALVEKEKSYSIQLELSESDVLEVAYLGKSLFSSEVEVVQDSLPEIEIISPIKQTENRLLGLKYTFKDDYPLKKMRLVVERHGSEDFVELTYFPKQKSVESQLQQDLTHHIYAGLSVNLSLEVEDAYGHILRSKTEPYILPQPLLKDPVAKALVMLRRELFSGQTAWQELAYKVQPYLQNPNSYKGDTFVHMMLAMTQTALLIEDYAQEGRIGEHLWQAAMRIEKGPLGQLLERAKERLSVVQENIQQELSASDIQPSYMSFESAMLDLLGALALYGDTDWGRQTGSLRREDFMRLMTKLKTALEVSNLNAAQKHAEKLAKLLGMIQPSNGDSEKLYKALKKMLEAFQNIQQSLSNIQQQSFKNGEAQQMDKKQQQSLADLLKQMQQLYQQMEGAPEVQSMLKRAMDSLKQAQQLAKSGDKEMAHQFLTESIKSMQAGQKGFLEYLQSQMGQNGKGLKRNPSGELAGEESDLNEEDPASLSKKIRDELFEKSGDQQRPQDEKDYFKRLLERF